MPDELDKWLELHSLGHYAEAFKKQDVRVSDLPILTKNDLIEIGLPIGPRRRMLPYLEAISASKSEWWKLVELRDSLVSVLYVRDISTEKKPSLSLMMAVMRPILNFLCRPVWHGAVPF